MLACEPNIYLFWVVFFLRNILGNTLVYFDLV